MNLRSSCLSAAGLTSPLSKMTRCWSVPSILTTPFAGAAARIFGTRPAFGTALALAGLGLPLLLLPNLAAVIVGLMLVGIGTLSRSATATGFVGRAVTVDRGSASAFILPATSLGGWSAPPYWASSSIGSDGQLVSPGLRSAWPRRHIWQFTCGSDRMRAQLDFVTAQTCLRSVGYRSS
jgi:MFS family permease